MVVLEILSVWKSFEEEAVGDGNFRTRLDEKKWMELRSLLLRLLAFLNYTNNCFKSLILTMRKWITV